MKKQQHHTKLVLSIVLIVALTAVFFLYKGTGRAVEIGLPSGTDIETVGTCCCTDNSNVFRFTTDKVESSLTFQDCQATCQEHSTDDSPLRPVLC